MNRRFATLSSLLGATIITIPSAALSSVGESDRYRPFNRIASFLVYENTDIDTQTVAEIVSATDDGMLLVYTDSQTGKIGFVDITDPNDPQPAGTVDVGGEPTSVTVSGPYALAAVNTSPSFQNPSGVLQVIDIETRTIARTIDLGGQPDSTALSPDGRYAALAIENERDEDFGNGEPPQLPGGYVVIVELVGEVGDWTTRTVDLTGVPDLFPEDPEPEFVDINRDNILVVSLQENNHIALIELATGEIIDDFSAGSVNLSGIDAVENNLIEQIDAMDGVPREPDAMAWISNWEFASADEGDLFGGSRGFTIFDAAGVSFRAGNALERVVARIGHYPEDRSENKGNEPEGLEFARYAGQGDGEEDGERLLFVGSERASVVFVYRLNGQGDGNGDNDPELMQVLPAGLGPEGLLAIPQRNLFVVASEEDAREDGVRSVISIYERSSGDGARHETPAYPTIQSRNGSGGAPIPWAALSGLAAPSHGQAVFTIHDSYYHKSRIYRMNVNDHPAVITGAIVLTDSSGRLMDSLLDLKSQLPGTDDFLPENLVNDDGSVNLDPEGVEVRGSRFWIASEGSGNLVDGVSDPDNQPFESPNLLVEVGASGNILQVVQLPLALTRDQLRFGFEGVAEVKDRNSADDGDVLVAFQRAWQAAGDPADLVRIGRYDPDTGEWSFAHYPLDPPQSPNGGWVGLSDLTYIGDGTFLVLERDNQAGPDARIKRLYTFSIDGLEFRMHDEGNFAVIEKTLIRDLLLEGDFDHTGGLVPEKLEGMAVRPNGDVLIVNDNDGVDGSNGETQLLNLGRILD